MNYQIQVDNLFEEQKLSWEAFSQNTLHLNSLEYKNFHFRGIDITVQYNPNRIKSSSANIDKEHIKERSCFLCKDNRPKCQNLVLFNKNYEILCNPYPIFNKHYTIVATKHTPQQIKTSFNNFLDIIKALPNLIHFYNAPQSGASAPDHLHFQAGNKGFIPIEINYEYIITNYGIKITQQKEVEITAVNDHLRKFIIIKSNNKNAVEKAFDLIYLFMHKLSNNEEPMLNIIAWYNLRSWNIIIFPRSKYRPWQFYEKGDKNILLSPASVELGGLFITPLLKDFNKITHTDIISILNQVSISSSTFKNLITHIKNSFRMDD